jgi:hypothetical protein
MEHLVLALTISSLRRCRVQTVLPTSERALPRLWHNHPRSTRGGLSQVRLHAQARQATGSLRARGGLLLKHPCPHTTTVHTCTVGTQFFALSGASAMLLGSSKWPCPPCFRAALLPLCLCPPPRTGQSHPTKNLQVAQTLVCESRRARKMAGGRAANLGAFGAEIAHAFRRPRMREPDG